LEEEEEDVRKMEDKKQMRKKKSIKRPATWQAR